MAEFFPVLECLQFRLLASVDINADSQKASWFAIFIEPHSRTGGHPMYTPVRENDPILGIVIFTLLDRVVDCLSNPIAIVGMNPRNKMFERDFSGSRPSPKSPSRVRDPGLIFA